MPEFPDLLDGRKYLLDVSAIPDLIHLRDGLPPGFLLVSQDIDELLRLASPEDGAHVLQTMLRFDEDEADRSSSIAVSDFGAIRDAYNRLRDRGVIGIIENEPPPDELSSIINQLLSVDAPDSSATLTNGRKVTAKSVFVRHLAAILGHSRRTGTAIISKGKGFVRRITQYAMGLELPRKADAILAKKEEFLKRLYSRTGGLKSGKYFIGAVVEVTAIFVHPLGVVGVALYFVDP